MYACINERVCLDVCFEPMCMPWRHLVVNVSGKEDKHLTATMRVLVIMVLAVVDAVTESHHRDALGAFAATPRVWPAMLVRVCNVMTH